LLKRFGVILLIKIRSATLKDVKEIAKVHIDSWRTTYKEIVAADFINGLTYEWSEQRMTNLLTNQDMFIYVAEDKYGKIVGFASGGLERNNDNHYKGELYAIYLLENCQRKGIGRKLFNEVKSHLKQQEINSMLVLVLEDNQLARDFYVSLGGKKIREGLIRFGGVEYKDIVYGWEDIS
jgi:ribosomal protein S18 acetylase RimI-like enzyme